MSHPSWVHPTPSCGLVNTESECLDPWLTSSLPGKMLRASELSLALQNLCRPLLLHCLDHHLLSSLPQAGDAERTLQVNHLCSNLLRELLLGQKETSEMTPGTLKKKQCGGGRCRVGGGWAVAGGTVSAEKWKGNVRRSCQESTSSKGPLPSPEHLEF